MVVDGQVRACERFCFGIVIMAVDNVWNEFARIGANMFLQAAVACVGRMTAGRITSTGMITVMHAPVNRVSMLPDLKKKSSVILRPALTAE